MIGERADAALSRRAFVLIALSIAFLFLLLRVPLVLARGPFFDELFTLWIAAKPATEIWRALRLDSGPPLYYLLAHAIFAITKSSLLVARAISLVASAVALVALLAAKWPPRTRLSAAFFFAIFPASVYFASEARSYALAGALAGIGVILLDRWSEEGEASHLALATIALVAAAWAHDYGVLLFPLPILFALLCRRDGERPAARLRDAILATIAEAVLFVPGFWLAAHQPAEATQWIGNMPPLRSAQLSLVALTRLSFAASYPDLFSPSPAVAIRIVSFGMVVLVVAFGTRTLQTLRWATATLLPLLLAFLFALAGRSIYFPFRFEAFIAIPFVVWLALVWSRLPRMPRVATIAVAGGTAAVTLALLLSYQTHRGDDAYRAASKIAVASAKPREAIVGTGSAYLELVSRSRDVIAFPAEQALHPGWRAFADGATLEREAESLRRRHASLIWVGEPIAPEYGALATRFTIAPIARFGPVEVARVTPRE